MSQMDDLIIHLEDGTLTPADERMLTRLLADPVQRAHLVHHLMLGEALSDALADPAVSPPKANRRRRRPSVRRSVLRRRRTTAAWAIPLSLAAGLLALVSIGIAERDNGEHLAAPTRIALARIVALSNPEGAAGALVTAVSAAGLAVPAIIGMELPSGSRLRQGSVDEATTPASSTTIAWDDGARIELEGDTEILIGHDDAVELAAGAISIETTSGTLALDARVMMAEMAPHSRGILRTAGSLTNADASSSLTLSRGQASCRRRRGAPAVTVVAGFQAIADHADEIRVVTSAAPRTPIATIAAASTWTLSPEADVFARRSGYNKATPGSHDRMWASLVPNQADRFAATHESFLRFDLAAVTRRPQAATLHLAVLSVEPGVNRLEFFLCDDDQWIEGPLDWERRPRAGRSLGSVDCTAGQTTLQFDLGEAVAAEWEGDGRISIGIRSLTPRERANSWVIFATREYADPARHPRLVVHAAP